MASGLRIPAIAATALALAALTAATGTSAQSAADTATFRGYDVRLDDVRTDGPQCPPRESLGGRQFLHVGPDPLQPAGAVEGLIDLDAGRVFRFHASGGRGRHALVANDADASTHADDHIELDPRDPEDDVRLSLRVGGQCRIDARVIATPRWAGDDARRELHRLAATYAFTRLLFAARRHELAARFADAEAATLAGQGLSEQWIGPRSRAAGIARLRLASIAWSRGDYDRSAELGEAAVAAIRNGEERAFNDVIAASINLALAYRDGGQPLKAAGLLRGVLDEAERELGADHEETIAAVFNLGLVYQDLETPERALPLLERAYSWRARQLGESNLRTLRSREALAISLGQAGRLREAVELAEQTQRLYESAHGPRHVWALQHQSALGSLIGSHSDDRRGAELVRNAAEALGTVVGPAHAGAVQARLRLVILLVRQKQYRAALEEIDRLFADGAVRLDARRKGLLRLHGATARAALGDHEGALRDVDAAHGHYVEGHGESGNATQDLLRHRGSYLLRLGRRAEAIDALERWVAFSERQRDSTGLTEGQRQDLLAGRHGAYRELVAAHLLERQPARAFAVSEMVKARSLLDSLATRAALSATGLDEETRATFSASAQRIAKLDERLARPDIDPGERLRLEVERNGLERDVQARRAALVARSPRFGALARVDLVDAEAARRLLRPGEAAISYLVADGRLQAFVTSADRELEVFDLGPADALRERVDAWMELLANPAASNVWKLADGTWRVADELPIPGAVRITDWRIPAAELGDTLIAPLWPRLSGARSLVLVPDGPLAEMPFDALIVGGQPLVTRRELRVVQSMSILARMRATPVRGQRGVTPDGLLAVGDPLYSPPGTPGGAAALASLRARVRSSASDLATRSADRSGSPARWLAGSGAGGGDSAWPPLPGSRREVEAVAASFRARTGTPVTVLLGERASEQLLQAMNRSGSLRGYRYLHFASHGYVDPSAPALSALVLSQVGTTPEADGFVTAAEWLSYTLDSDLIVASACETARGTQLNGEGVLGLPYAMFVAGNRNAVLTLWKIPDRSSAVFVSDFMRKVAAGADPAAALAETKRSFVKRRAFAHPVHWAPFVLYGG